MHCDNYSVIHSANNQVFHARTKHIDVKYHKLREIINDGLVCLVKIHTEINVADIFTKPVTEEKFTHCLGFIGVLIVEMMRELPKSSCGHANEVWV